MHTQRFNSLQQANHMFLRQHSLSALTKDSRPRTSRPGGSRRGVATIETAVTLPLLAFLTFGSIELSNMMFLRQSMSIASYEGARSATRPGGSQGLAATKIQEVLTARGVASFSVAFNPTITTATPRGTMIQVTVTTPTTSISYAPFRLFSGSTVSSSSTMVRQ
jgi:Flp pilus assembly protein TadG